MKIFNKYACATTIIKCARATVTIRVLNKCLGRLCNNVTFSKGVPDSSVLCRFHA